MLLQPTRSSFVIRPPLTRTHRQLFSLLKASGYIHAAENLILSEAQAKEALFAWKAYFSSNPPTFRGIYLRSPIFQYKV